MATTKQDINDFQARVKRIKSPRNNSYYDPDLDMHIPKRVGRDKIKKAKRDEDVQILGPVIVSMILGAVALMFAEVLRIRYFGLADQNSATFAVEMVLTLWALLMLGAALDRRSVGARLSQFAGAGLMMIAGHNLIWRWPDQMAYIYTQAHVDQVLLDLPQHSVVISGTIYGL